MKIKFNVEPMGAVRMTRKGKFVDAAAQRYLSYKTVIGFIAKRNKPNDPYKGALEASMTFYMPIPQSWTKTKQEAHKGDNVPHVCKPDIDNLEKGLYDALNKIIWNDDAQIFRVKEKAKFYSEFPRIEFEITEVVG